MGGGGIRVDFFKETYMPMFDCLATFPSTLHRGHTYFKIGVYNCDQIIEETAK